MRSILASLALGLVLGLLLATVWLAPHSAGAQPPPDPGLDRAAQVLRLVRQIEQLLVRSEAARLASDCTESGLRATDARELTAELWDRYSRGDPVNVEAVEVLDRRISEVQSRDCPPINTAQRAQQVIQQALTEARNARTAGDCYAARFARDRARAIVEEPATSALFTAPLLEQWKTEVRAEDAFSCTNVVPQTATPCPSTFPGGVTSLNCRCPVGPHRRSAYGNFYYAEESGLCAAAQHAGAIRRQGGSIVARVQEGRTYYVGTFQNGIQSFRRGPSNRTITFAGTYNSREERFGRFPLCKDMFRIYPAAERRSGLTCRCLVGIRGWDGAVFGSGPYASHSGLCAAARHAGALRSVDGLITVIPLPSQNEYRASTQNGVTSRYMSLWPEAMRIVSASD
jgi:hypothetical protein